MTQCDERICNSFGLATRSSVEVHFQKETSEIDLGCRSCCKYYVDDVTESLMKTYSNVKQQFDVTYILQQMATSSLELLRASCAASIAATPHPPLILAALNDFMRLAGEFGSDRAKIKDVLQRLCQHAVPSAVNETQGQAILLLLFEILVG